ncbi:MAG: regulatory protein RecX [Pseudomonadales bacterium]|nr:regulatory protein RecX [Pseudomonadales bacterium]
MADTSLSSAQENPGLEDPELENHKQTEAAYRTALDSAVRYLARREHSRAELAQKLRRKGIDRTLIDRVLAYVGEHDLQSDSRFIETYVRSRRERGYGPVRIRQELGSRGIAESDLEDTLTESAEFWMDIARRVLARKFHVPPETREAWNTQARFLAQRGFPSDLIYRVLD